METGTPDQPNSYKTIVRFLASCYFWAELFLISALLFPLAFVVFLFTAPFDKRLYVLHKYTCLWSFIVLKINFFWRIRINGREKIDPRCTYVMVCNHQSGADIIVLFLLWAHFKWIAKKSLFSYPFIGWNMRLNRYISLDRSNPSSMRKMMADAQKAILGKNSVMIFPEGTRSKDGNLQPFKSGAFHLAIENKVPVIPIVITGTSKAIRKGGFLINRNHDIRATVLDPLPVSTIEGMNPKVLSSRVHQLIRSELESRV